MNVECTKCVYRDDCGLNTATGSLSPKTCIGYKTAEEEEPAEEAKDEPKSNC
jgi:hypothetical protein